MALLSTSNNLFILYSNYTSFIHFCLPFFQMIFPLFLIVWFHVLLFNFINVIIEFLLCSSSFPSTNFITTRPFLLISSICFKYIIVSSCLLSSTYNQDLQLYSLYIFLIACIIVSMEGFFPSFICFSTFLFVKIFFLSKERKISLAFVVTTFGTPASLAT